MDAAKTRSVDDAARVLADYGPGAQMVNIELANVTREAFDSFQGDEAEPVRWGPGMVTRRKSRDAGSGVHVGMTLIEREGET